jgi:isocitrate dehydrogenase
MTQNQNCLHLTDEAPLLLILPIVQAFTATAGIEMETKDISLAAKFYQFQVLNEDQKWKML